MKVRAIALTCAPLILAAVLSAAKFAQAEDYGISGGPVGWDRIVKISRMALSGPGDKAADITKWYGNAGGPVGADAIAQAARRASPAPSGDFALGYGRAGGPVGLASRQTTGSSKVVQMK